MPVVLELAGPRTVSLCDMMLSFVTTVLRICLKPFVVLKTDNVKMTVFLHEKGY